MVDKFEPLEATLAKYHAEIGRVRAGIEAKLPGAAAEDLAIYRFLKGWKFDEAKENRLDEIGLKAPSMDQKEYPFYDKIIRVYPHRVSHKTDRLGQPLSIERLGRTHPALLVQTVKLQELDEYQKYHVESKDVLARQLTQETGTVMRMAKIIDLDGLGTKHCHRGGLGYFKHCLGWTQNCYPEMLGNLYIVNAPWIFKTLWAVVKPWLNESTLSKIQILGANYQTVLHKDIDPANLPTWLGGTCNCEGGCVVELDPDAGFTVVEVKARSLHRTKVDLAEGTTASWEFRTRAHDIRFGVVFLPQRAGAAQETVVGLHKFNAAQETASGAFETKEAGTLELIFDNGYSLFTGKTLLYRVDVTVPEPIIVADDVKVSGVDELKVPSAGSAPASMDSESEPGAFPAAALEPKAEASVGFEGAGEVAGAQVDDSEPGAPA